MKKTSLSKYKKNIFSQDGEDGIIEEIFNTIGTTNKVCIEFGAWDGLRYSNTANLWKKGWKALLIEMSDERFAELKRKTAGHNCICVNAKVTPYSPYTIDEIAERAGLPKEIDLISIDIDGDDYYILNSIQKLNPRVIICEYNPTIPPEFEIVATPNNHFGSSALAITTLAESKNYKLVSLTATNCIFVQEKEYKKFENFETNLKKIMPQTFITYLITGYDGDYATVGNSAYGLNYPTRQSLSLGSIHYLPMINIGWAKKHFARKEYLRNFLMTLGITVIAKHAGQMLQIVRWRLKRLPNPPQAAKAMILKSYARRYKLERLVETGTYLGDTINSLKKEFREIHSIELSPYLYKKARQRFAADNKINLHLGNSRDVLPNLLLSNEATLFWLDGHYSGGVTARGEEDSPIKSELESIFSTLGKKVILIDDARCFNGHNGYPTINDVENMVTNLAPGYKTEVKSDIIRITPRE